MQRKEAGSHYPEELALVGALLGTGQFRDEFAWSEFWLTPAAGFL